MLRLGRISSSRIGSSMGNSWPFGRRALTTPPPYHSWTDVVAGTAAKGEGQAMRELASIDVLTFNMLAPCYKRLSTRNATGRRHRESYDRKAWRPRAERTFDFFREEIFPSASIIALQEFWMGEEEYKKMFLDEFERQGFEVLTLQRTGDKMDAVALVVKTSEFEILARHNVNLNSLDRIALLLWLRHKATGKNLLLANTHLSFPHTSLDRMFQMRQMSTLVAEMDVFEKKHKLEAAAVTRVIMGDFNVEAWSPVCAHLRQEGYVSGLDSTTPRRPGQDALLVAGAGGEGEGEGDKRAYKPWVSHRTHRGEDLGVDHIFVKPELEWRFEPSEGTEAGTRAGAGAGAGTGTVGSPLPVGGIFVGEALVLPTEIPSESWPLDFTVSDHRPVRVRLVFGRSQSSS